MEGVIGALLKDPPKEGQGAQWALTVAVLLLAVAIGWLIRKLDKNSKTDSARAEAFREAQAKHQTETDKRFLEAADRMACIERDYLPRSVHYKDIGGWRTDLNDLRSAIGDELRAVRKDMNTLIPSIINIAMQQKGGHSGNQG
jgi:hypothetical protein